LLEVIASDIKADSGLKSGDTAIMQLSVNNYSNINRNGKDFYFNIGISEAFTNTVAYLKGKGILNENSFSEVAETIESLTLDMSDEKIIVTDKEEIAQILQNLTYYSEKEGFVRVLARINDEMDDIDVGYIGQDMIPKTVRDRMSGI
jgi:hypothetical protein